MSKRVVHTMTAMPLKREAQDNFTLVHIIDLYGYAIYIFVYFQAHLQD
jgi:hypothetical protein